METLANTPPGIWPGVPFADYCTIPAMNATTLLHGRNSMAHLKAAIDGKLEDEDTKALNMGRAFHCRVLEPDLFSSRYAVAKPCCAILASGKRKGEPCGNAGLHGDGDEWYCGQHANDDAPVSGKDRISEDEFQRIEAMRASVMAHPIIKQIRRRGGFETTAIGDVEGVLCKARFDKLITDGPGRPVIIDLKKCRVGYGSRDRIDRAIFDYAYYFRAALYLDVLKAAGGPADVPFVLVFVEDEYPYAVNVTQVSDEWIEIGRVEYTRLLAELTECQKSGVWPGYRDEDGNVDIWPSRPPAWLKKKYRHLFEALETEEALAGRHPDADVMW